MSPRLAHCRRTCTAAAVGRGTHPGETELPVARATSLDVQRPRGAARIRSVRGPVLGAELRAPETSLATEYRRAARAQPATHASWDSDPETGHRCAPVPPGRAGPAREILGAPVAPQDRAVRVCHRDAPHGAPGTRTHRPAGPLGARWTETPSSSRVARQRTGAGRHLALVIVAVVAGVTGCTRRRSAPVTVPVVWRTALGTITESRDSRASAGCGHSRQGLGAVGSPGPSAPPPFRRGGNRPHLDLTAPGPDFTSGGSMTRTCSPARVQRGNRA